MRALGILHRLIRPRRLGMHLRRFRALSTAAEALLRGGRASVTALGRTVKKRVNHKHSIKRIDRLIGNRNLHSELPSIYGALATVLLRNTDRPAILVDYTDLPSGFVALAAAIANEGRAIPLYFEVYPERKLNNGPIQRRFLRRLKALLPKRCRPIVVTDAGFYASWFQTVQSLGWDYVGRIRNRTKFKMTPCGPWLTREQVMGQITSRPVDFGEVLLNKNSPSRHRLVGVRRKGKPRSHRSRGRGTPEKKCRLRANEPWVIATSLDSTAEQVVNVYSQRMQIEANFRDAKNDRWGFCLGHARSHSAERWAVLLLLCALGTVTLMVIGESAEKALLHRRYQANTIRTRRVLSLFVLGWFVLKDARSLFPAPQLRELLGHLASRE